MVDFALGLILLWASPRYKSNKGIETADKLLTARFADAWAKGG